MLQLGHDALGRPGFDNPPVLHDKDVVGERARTTRRSNALQRSPFWNETAAIINYDDSDDWYDHVLGPAVNNSTNLATADPGNPNIGGDNNETNANDSFIPTLPLPTSTTP